MKNELIGRRQFLALALPFAVALPGYRYEFPRDHFSHPEFQTEWWYYTGSLRSGEQRFGFQLTFFRRAKSRDAATGVWSPDPVWLGHSALSDVSGGVYRHAQRLNRSGPGLAGADREKGLVWNGNWNAGPTALRSVDDAYVLDLSLNALKPPVIHGQNGVSQKAAGAGRASHYISLPRIAARGTLHYENRALPVEGLAWMDHEFFTHQLAANQTGWDWFSIQLADNTELMLYRLRRSDGSVDSFSAGTYVDAQGKSRHLSAKDFELIPGPRWRSPRTGTQYPVQWEIRVPALGLALAATTPLPQQEVLSKGSYSPNYWEGVVDYRGTRAGAAITGSGYLEVTGYDKPVGSL